MRALRAAQAALSGTHKQADAAREWQVDESLTNLLLQEEVDG